MCRTLYLLIIFVISASLKHLDLSHNQIDAWFLEAGVDNMCYSEIQEPVKKSSSSRMIPKMSKLSITSSNCSHKKHSRLDNLRTLILSDNLLDHLKIHTTSSRNGLSFRKEIYLLFNMNSLYGFKRSLKSISYWFEFYCLFGF